MGKLNPAQVRYLTRRAGTWTATALSDMTLLRDMKVDATVHGFRSSFRLRCYNSAITAVSVREAGPFKGEQVHILLSVPPSILRSFTRMQRGWFNKIGADRT